MLLLKTAYHPNWRVTVDGEPAESLMLMPGYLGVQLAPGHHEVMVEYKSRTLRKVLMVLGILSLLTIAVWEWRRDAVPAWLGQRVSAGVCSNPWRGRSSRTERRWRSRRNR